MKNLSKVLALVLVVAMVFSFAVSASAKTSFKDDASIKYEEAVELLSALKVINGYTDGTFKPTGSITRGEFAVMVSYMVANDWSEIPLYSDIKQLGKDYAPYCTFADTKNHWSAGYVAYCAGNGYISGRNANVFDPDATITAAEISVILLRVMGYDATIEDFGTTSGTTKGYNTQLTARNAGLLNGLDTMNFWAAATREQAAQLMFNALKGKVVTYGNVTFTLALDGRVVVSNLNNTKATVTARDLMSYCFRNVDCVDATDINGYSGHQWVAYAYAIDPEKPDQVLPVSAKLTDVYRDDTTIGEYVGGTSYKKIAADLGVTSKDVRKTTEVYVNGGLVGGTDVVAHEDYPVSGPQKLPINLVDLYQKGVDGKALPDNCRLIVVKDSDRNQAATSYKFLYYYELVGKVTNIQKITNAKDAHYGEYMYTITYWYDYPTKTSSFETRYAFAATDSAYSPKAFYLVEPNESEEWQPSANIKVGEGYQDFLSIKVAKTEAPVKFVSGTYQTFAKNVGNAASDGAKNYKISSYAHDFVDEAGYLKNMTLIYNTAGYVQGFAPYSEKDNNEYGYVYIDSVEFEVTATASSRLIRKADGTLSAQAMALAYFPTAAGNSTPVAINLAINQRAWTVALAKANNGVDPAVDAFVKDTYIQLPTDTTNAFHDDPTFQYNHYQAGNVRVYDVTFDGWYEYVKYQDGSYSLAPVGTASIDTVKGDANTNLTIEGVKYFLSSSTADNIYNMDLGTMTASVTTVTGYKNIATGTHGGLNPAKDPVEGKTYVPYIGRVGGEIAANDRNQTVAIIDEFNISTPANALRYALYKGTSGSYALKGGQYRLKFLGAGVAHYLFAAEKVNFNGTVINGSELQDKLVPADKLYKTSTDEKGNKIVEPYTNYVVYALTLNADNEIVAVKSLPLDSGIAFGTDVDGYIRIDNVAKNFDTKQVWNFTNGKEETIADSDVIYYLDADKDGVIDIMWIGSQRADAVSSPNYYDLIPRTPPYIWWVR